MKKVVFAMMLVVWAFIVIGLCGGCAGQKKVIESQPVEASQPTPEPTPEWTESRMVRPLPPTYTVVKGDCLWKIAENQYSDPFQWPSIWKANLDKIRDPHWIYPKQVFDVPKDQDADSVKEARSVAKVYGSQAKKRSKKR